MRIIICDDNIETANLLMTYVYSYFNKSGTLIPEISVFHSGDDLLDDTGKKDIVFLDVEMPGVDGICTGRKLKEMNKKTIIFIVTSYMEYLDAAMKFNVFRYLSKPIEKERLFSNLRDAVRLYYEATNPIAIETKEGIHMIAAADVIMVEARERKVTIYTAESVYISVNSMKYWMKQLSIPGFYATHRSYIVNMRCITDFDRDTIILNHTHRAYLTRRNYHVFKKAYLMYLESQC